MRIGFGYDAHRFATAGELTLGGIKIPHPCGLIAHSDGDVLLHAITDALLGALALGDIGEHFPDSDAKWRGQSSVFFIQHVLALVQKKDYRVENIDCTLLAEVPKIKPHYLAIRTSIAQMMGISLDQISVKATTNEKMGALGRAEGMAAYAIVLLTK